MFHALAIVVSAVEPGSPPSTSADNIAPHIGRYRRDGTAAHRIRLAVRRVFGSLALRPYVPLNRCDGVPPGWCCRQIGPSHCTYCRRDIAFVRHVQSDHSFPPPGGCEFRRRKRSRCCRRRRPRLLCGSTIM